MSKETEHVKIDVVFYRTLPTQNEKGTTFCTSAQHVSIQNYKIFLNAKMEATPLRSKDREEKKLAQIQVTAKYDVDNNDQLLASPKTYGMMV